ncbi:MAG: non-heme iron oxygenase ferredoxin subunit [Aeromicrobium sp.]|uniref:Rieske (2Fe-2S) protein n=1 Tax=Aeromicrobium sp. TaxID=1871063 RepID=UPI0039E69B1A
MSEQFAAPFADIPDGGQLATVVDGNEIVLVRDGEEVFALRDECSHAAIPLSEGECDGQAIECWLHGSRFDVRTGEPLNFPATEPVPTYPTTIKGGRVYVALPEEN